jgi:hypothetical protein
LTELSRRGHAARAAVLETPLRTSDLLHPREHTGRRVQRARGRNPDCVRRGRRREGAAGEHGARAGQVPLRHPLTHESAISRLEERGPHHDDDTDR